MPDTPITTPQSNPEQVPQTPPQPEPVQPVPQVMQPGQQIPTVQESRDEPQRPKAVETYQSDLARAMDTTEAKAVQELLETAREKEAYEKEREVVHHQRSWYTTGGIILILLALGAAAYGVWYYRNLTVSVAPRPAAGVFQSLEPIVASDTTIETSVASLTTNESIPEGKPFVVPIVGDSAARAALDPESALAFMKVNLGEPFLATISLVRFGVMNTGDRVSPFIIFSTPTPELATKEFLIAEPTLLEKVRPALNITTTSNTSDIGTSFVSKYMYNLPVRILTATDIDTQVQTILLYYGYATDNTIVLATDPTVLKAVYDTIIRQR